MCLVRAQSLAAIVAVMSLVVPYIAQPQADTIQIKELSDAFELSGPVSRLIMTIPKGGFTQKKSVRRGAADSPRYFYFEDKALNLIISGWFEPESGFSGINKFWESETKEWDRKGLPKPHDVSFEKIHGWDAIIYDISIPNGSNSHVRAHWLEAGTWIDIHISLTSDRPSGESRAKMVALLKTIQVKERK